MAHELPFTFTTDLNSGKDFDRNKCKLHCCCDVDFVEILVAGYQMKCRNNWERCLDMKWSVTVKVSASA